MCPKCCFPILSSSPCVMQNKQTSKKRQTKKNQELERHSSKSDQRNKIPLIASADDVLLMKDCLVSVMTIWHLPDTAHAVDPRIFYWHIFKLQWKSVEIASGGVLPFPFRGATKGDSRQLCPYTELCNKMYLLQSFSMNYFRHLPCLFTPTVYSASTPAIVCANERGK